jgi:uncharacterized protein YwqG
VSEIWQTLSNKLQGLNRKAWKPWVENGDSSIIESKFSGTPWLAVGEAWPACQFCNQPMPLFLQLNLDSLPRELNGIFGTGLMQLFYCTSCDDFEPFTGCHLVRIVQPASSVGSVISTPIQDPFPAKKILGWKEMEEEFPDYRECERIGIVIEEEEKEYLNPELGDKLGGWPHWIQDIEYPSCRICGNPMRLVFQLDSNDNLPFMFGDSGCGHITQCSEHKEELAFGWACF